MQELQEFRLQCMAFVAAYLTGYVWQQDPFTLQSSEVRNAPWSTSSVSKSAAKGHHPKTFAYLWGTTCFGDCVEDEWLIVWLIVQVTKKVGSSLFHCFNMLCFSLCSISAGAMPF